jgi:starvation-inducible DNA-binding protein
MSIVETYLAVAPEFHDADDEVPSELTRSAVVEVANRVLAHTLDLGLQARRVHWNLTDPRFVTLREMLPQFVQHLDTYADRAAERAVQLNGVAQGAST